MERDSREHVLIVDDEPQVLVALEDLLAEHFEVSTAGSADEALAIAASRSDIAVVLCDQRMPRLSGDELFARLAETSDSVRILVTAFADIGAVARAVNDGRIFAYVIKPWDGPDLLGKVRRAARQFRAARAAVEERQLLRDLMDNLPDGIYFKDASLRIRRANQAFATFIGRASVSEIIGKRLSDFERMREHAEEIEAEEARVLAEGLVLTDVIREYPGVSAGSSRWLAETKASTSNASGRRTGVVGIVRDVTRQRTLEMDLAQAQKMDAIGRLAGGIAHDFNNLLAVILSYGEFIHAQVTELPGQTSLHEDSAQIIAAAQRAAGLTRQLLAFSRRQVVQPRTLKVGEVLVNLEKMLRRIVGEDVRLTVRTVESGKTVADAGQLEQILLNLVVNARDAMPQGGQLIIETSDVLLDSTYTELHADMEPGRFVLITVTDTGIGMTRDTVQRIFEPFFTTKEHGKGTGLGLATVYGIVKNAGGHVSVYSELGTGTVFKVYLRRADEEIAVEPLVSEIAELSQGTGTILLLEDDDSVRRIASRILRAQGYVVLEARHAGEARAVFAQHQSVIDLVLTDLVLPDVSGARLAEELMAVKPGLRALFMSGYPGTAVHEARLAYGQPYIEKPFTPKLLASKVRDVMGAKAERG